MANRISCHELEMLLMLNIFQLVQWCCSRGSVLIFIYQVTAYNLKSKNAQEQKNAHARAMQTATIRAKSRWTASLYFSSIHLFTTLKWSFLSIVRWNCNPKLLSQNRILPSHPMSQCCAQQWRPCQYRVGQHWKWGAGKISDKYTCVVQHFQPWL